MKMTNDVTKRCEDMLCNFARKYGVDMSVEHDMDHGNTKVDVRSTYSFRPIETYIIIWDEARNLSEACTSIFVDLTRKLNLDGYDTEAFKIKNVVFNYPATIVLWDDGTKTVVKCQDGDTYSKETGLALCIAKKALGNQGNFNEVFKKWIPEDERTSGGDEEVVVIPTKALFNPDFMAAVSENIDKALKRFRCREGCV